MTVTVYTADKEFSEIFKGETANPVLFSREVVTIITGQNLAMGAVVGKITASGKITELNEDASDGSETAYGVVIANYDATSADLDGVAMVRDAYLATENLVWNATIDAGEKTTALAELAAKGLIAKEIV